MRGAAARAARPAPASEGRPAAATEARPGPATEARPAAATEEGTGPASGARLAEATWPEVESRAAAGPRTLLVPLGATEQHGPHLPLGTDSTIAVALAEAAAARTADTTVAPLLPYGSSGEHQDFPGTLSIGAAATELVLVELGRSAAETFDRILFVNAHGGNAAPLAGAVMRLRREGRDARAWSPDWGGDAHAGRTETSLMLALEAAERGRPLARQQVRGRPLAPTTGQKTTAAAGAGQRTTAVRGGMAEAGNDAPLAELIGRLRTEGVRAVSPNGVLGDPTGASAAEGRALLAAAVDDLCAAFAGPPDRDESDAASPAAAPSAAGATR